MPKSETAIVGILCRDGVVIGTDSSTTFGAAGGLRTIEQPTDKLDIVGEKIVVAGTGQVGLGQRFVRIVAQAFDGGIFDNPDHIAIGIQLSRATLVDFSQTFIKPGQYAALAAFAVGGEPRLCEFAIDDFQPEFKTDKLWYVSMGSGQMICDPFLAFARDVFWKDGPPSLQEGIFAVTWTLDHVIKINAGGVGGPPKIGVLEKDAAGAFQARALDAEDLTEHYENIEEAKALLRKLPDKQKPTGATPAVPKPAEGPEPEAPAPASGAAGPAATGI